MAIYGRRVLRSIRNRGLRGTIEIILFKLKLILGLICPRTIWGEKIGLRAEKCSLTDREVKLIYEWSSDPDILRWTASFPNELNLDQFRDHLHRERWHPQYDLWCFYIVSRSRELIGKINLHSIDWTKSEGEFGIFIDKRYWNKHFGREATKLFINYVLTKTPIKRIYLSTFNENLRAQKAFAACGFRVIGTAGQFNPVLGNDNDGIKMEITRQDFRQ
jgi:RimJ/RimL family protein N-acetyltransferase